MNVGLFGVKHHETLLPIQQQSASIAGFIWATLSLQLIKVGNYLPIEYPNLANSKPISISY